MTTTTETLTATAECSRCESIKPLLGFYQCSTRANGRETVCKDCRKASRAISDAQHPQERGVWKNMHSRCSNPNRASYKYYGGSGITVCPEWKSLAQFIADMGTRPSLSHELDRIDNTKGYSKDNCRWISHKENMRNTRRNVITMEVAELMRHRFGVDGRTRKQVAEEFGVAYCVVRHVIAGDRWAKEYA
jgi:hypothetical protein